MMLIRNTKTRYGMIAIVFHWAMAILVIALLCVGLYMTSLPDSLQKLKLYGMHKEFGMLVLMLAFFRLGWLFLNKKPDFPEMPIWQVVAARGAHYALYALIFLMPLSGWMVTASAGLPVSFFGLFVIPNPIMANQNLLPFFENIHAFFAYSLIALIALHTSAALEHHFWRKDEVLRNMLSWKQKNDDKKE